MNWPLLKQLWIVNGMFVDFVGHGLVVSYASCLLPGLRAEDSPVKLDLNSASWLASILGIALGIGNLYISFLMERFVGRRWVHATTILTNLIAWLLQYWATDISTFMMARLLAGASMSGGYASGCVILAEYTTPEYRGIFLNITTVTMFSGYLIMHIMAHYIYWRTIALIGVIPCVFGIINNLTWPESPSWLASKNRFEECEKTFYWLRGQNEKSVKELEAMIRAQKLRIAKRPKNVTLSQKIRFFFDKFRQKNLLKPLAIVAFVTLLKEASGRHFFPVYALDILSQASTDKSNNFFFIILIDIVSLTSTIGSCLAVKVMGRRTLFMLSGIPAIVLLLLMSSTLFMKSRGLLNTEQTWLVPSLLCLFFVLVNLGCTSLPLVIYGEIFPSPVREIGVGVGGCVMSIIFFGYLKILPYLLTYLMLPGTFLVFAVSMTVSLAYIYFALPETKDRSLQEIEDYFEHGRFLNDFESPEDPEATVMLDPIEVGYRGRVKKINKISVS